MQPEHTHPKQYERLTIERRAPSLAIITGEIPVAVITEERERAIRALGKDVALPGFRKGHVPEALLVEHLGEQRILEEVAERVLAHAYGHILEDEKLDAVGRPAITLTKLAPGNPLGFRIETALYPQVTLPDYRTIAERAHRDQPDPELVAVEDTEVSAELLRLRQAFTQDPEEESGESVIPELTDDFVQRLGDFKTADEFTATLREQLLREKKRKAYEARRLAIIDAVLAKTKVEVPALFIESELEKMMGEFGESVRRMGMTIEAYLAKVEKSDEELRKEWAPDAEKRAKLQVLLNEIAKQEGIVPDENRFNREVGHIMEHYSQADESSVRAYVGTMLTNERVFELLEGGAAVNQRNKTDPGPEGTA